VFGGEISSSTAIRNRSANFGFAAVHCGEVKEAKQESDGKREVWNSHLMLKK
jgi:hypothetical protein